jgi:hypothetical protein
VCPAPSAAPSRPPLDTQRRCCATPGRVPAGPHNHSRANPKAAAGFVERPAGTLEPTAAAPGSYPHSISRRSVVEVATALRLPLPGPGRDCRCLVGWSVRPWPWPTSARRRPRRPRSRLPTACRLRESPSCATTAPRWTSAHRADAALQSRASKARRSTCQPHPWRPNMKSRNQAGRCPRSRRRHGTGGTRHAQGPRRPQAGAGARRRQEPAPRPPAALGSSCAQTGPPAGRCRPGAGRWRHPRVLLQRPRRRRLPPRHPHRWDAAR